MSAPPDARRLGWALPALAGALWTLAACDGAIPSVDASTPVSARTSAVSLRIDVSPQSPASLPDSLPASLSVLAFRAVFSGMAAAEILGMVDPLAADAPLHDCQVRDVDQAAAALVARGDAIELEELAGIGVSVAGDNAVEIRPSPRLYPDLAATIGGVVGEAGPLGLSSVPQEVRVRGGMTVVPSPNPSRDSSRNLSGDLAGDLSGDGLDLAVVGVPATGWIKTVNGSVPRDGMLIPISADLNLNLTPTEVTETSIELRPFGATVALTCVVPSNSVPASGQIPFTVSRQALDALVSAARATPGAPIAAALDLVRRSGKQMPLSATRVSLEVRTSTFVELRP